MNERYRKATFALALSAATVVTRADTVVTAHVDVQGVGTAQAVVPAAGDYRFVFGKDQATVASPNGKLFIFDFGRRTFTSLNPTLKTYYQTEIASVLGVGDRVAPGQADVKIKGAVTFEPNKVETGGPDLASAAKSYRVLLDSSSYSSGGSPGNFGGGFNTRGGLVFGGNNATERSSYTGRRVLEGELWMGAAPPALDRDQMNTAIECVLLWGAPQLKELANRIHDGGQAILGGSFSVHSEGQRNPVGIAIPTASIRVKSISDGTLDPTSMTIPATYRQVLPPRGPMGG